MSFLAPLYVLGALGIGLPIVFHLIRRQPRGQRLFSSLMFLKPTPPILTRRSRLENWPLLLLRALALILLAAAFARPFLRSPLIEPDDLPGKRIVLLIDTSASMRRIGLWNQTNKIAGEVLSQLRPTDQIAIVAFDSKPRLELSLEQSAALVLDARREAAVEAVNRLKPSWAAGDLGSALIFAADLLTTSEGDNLPVDSARKDSETSQVNDTASAALTGSPGHLVIISDMQVGDDENLKSLQAYSWPKEIKTEIRTVVASGPTNAFATVLQSRDGVADETSALEPAEEIKGKSRVRISNSTAAATADFQVVWAKSTGEMIESTSFAVHIGPGESRVVRINGPPAAVADLTALRLVLSGDDHDFDNARYVVRAEPIEQQLLFVGSTVAEPRDSLFYYLQRAPLDNQRRKVVVTSAPATAIPATIEVNKTPLVIIADTLGGPALESLRTYLSTGGGVVWVLDKNADLVAAQQGLQSLTQAADLSLTEAKVKDYAMWSKIDFADRLFKPLADFRYNDFTKIRFWSHRTLSGLAATANVIVSFDDGNPAIIEQTVGQGHLWIMAAGWQPTDSQLALSTKFVPLIDCLYGYNHTDSADIEQVVLGEESPFAPSPTARIVSADGEEFEYRDARDFEAVTEPGIYRLVDGNRTHLFAVNVAESESRTDPLTSDELERYGVVIGPQTAPADSRGRVRQQRDIELESRQHLWQWLLLGVLGLLGVESWLSGYLDRKQIRQLQANRT